MDNAETWNILLAIVLCLAGLAAFLYYMIVKRRDKWGINVKRVSCPECGALQPVVRKPKNFKQVMWGGNTCPECGTEMDKWGNRV